MSECDIHQWTAIAFFGVVAYIGLFVLMMRVEELEEQLRRRR